MPRSSLHAAQGTFILEAFHLKALIGQHQRSFVPLVKKDLADMDVRCGSGCQVTFGKLYCYPSAVHHHSNVVETHNSEYFLILGALTIVENILKRSAVHGILLFAKRLDAVLATPTCPLFKLPHLVDSPALLTSYCLLKPGDVSSIWTAVLMSRFQMVARLVFW